MLITIIKGYFTPKDRLPRLLVDGSRMLVRPMFTPSTSKLISDFYILVFSVHTLC